jgi:hypothetical protein
MREDPRLRLLRQTQEAYDEAELARRGLIRECEARIDLMRHSGIFCGFIGHDWETIGANQVCRRCRRYGDIPK